MEELPTVEVLTELFHGFLEHIRAKGFVVDEEEAKEPGKHLILSPQLFTAKAVIRAVFLKKRSVINLSIVRQLGKTEVIALLISYIFTRYYEIFKEPYRVVAVAPEKNTGMLIFERIVDYVPTGFFDKKKAGTTYRSKNGDSIEVFSMYDQRVGGTYEGRTINLVLRDEAHLGDDKKFKDQIRPTMIRTNGVVINIGNGSWRECLFTQGLEMGNKKEILRIGNFDYEIENVVIKRTYDDLRPYMLELAERGNRDCATWIAGVESDLMDGGRESLENRKNIFCEKILEKESFITIAEFDSCLVEPPGSSPDELIGALDIAKSIDRTVAMFGDLDYTLRDIKILKDSYERKDILDQIDELADYCDRKAYSEKLIVMGGDATGMGEAAIESVSIAMEAEIVPYKYSLQSKHKWYTELQTRILTNNPARKLKIPKDLPHLNVLRKELTELTVKASKSGECLIFCAPDGKNKFDDLPAALVQYVDLVGKITGYITDQIPFDKRNPKKKVKYNEPSNLIVTPREKRSNQNSGNRVRLVGGDY